MDYAMTVPEFTSVWVWSCIDLCSEECICSYNEQLCTKTFGCEGTLVEAICETIYTILASVQTGDDPQESGQFEVAKGSL